MEYTTERPGESLALSRYVVDKLTRPFLLSDGDGVWKNCEISGVCMCGRHNTGAITGTSAIGILSKRYIMYWLIYKLPSSIETRKCSVKY